MSIFERSPKSKIDSIKINEEAKSKLRWWFHLANIWRIVDNIFVILSFASSMFVVYIEASTEIKDKVMGVLIGSVLAAVFTILSFAIDPKTHMRNYRRAYKYLYDAILTHECAREDDRDINELIFALQTGEEIINSSYDVDSEMVTHRNSKYKTSDVKKNT